MGTLTLRHLLDKIDQRVCYYLTLSLCGVTDCPHFQLRHPLCGSKESDISEFGVAITTCKKTLAKLALDRDRFAKMIRYFSSLVKVKYPV